MNVFQQQLGETMNFGYILKIYCVSKGPVVWGRADFQMSKDTRPGCPLFPLLFIIALEIWQEKQTLNLKIYRKEYKLKCYLMVKH